MNGDVFVVATANDIATLAPELLRKDRFVGIFFVDLTDTETRIALVRIHLGRRGHDPCFFGLTSLAGSAESFYGSRHRADDLFSIVLRGGRRQNAHHGIVAPLNPQYPPTVENAGEINSNPTGMGEGRYGSSELNRPTRTSQTCRVRMFFNSKEARSVMGMVRRRTHGGADGESSDLTGDLLKVSLYLQSCRIPDHFE